MPIWWRDVPYRWNLRDSMRSHKTPVALTGSSQEYILASEDLLRCSIGIKLSFLHLLVEFVQHLMLLQSRYEHGHKTLLQQRHQFLLTALAAAHEELPGSRQG